MLGSLYWAVTRKTKLVADDRRRGDKAATSDRLSGRSWIDRPRTQSERFGRIVRWQGLRKCARESTGSNLTRLARAPTVRPTNRDLRAMHPVRCAPVPTETIALGRKNEPRNRNTCGARHHDSRTPCYGEVCRPVPVARHGNPRPDRFAANLLDLDFGPCRFELGPELLGVGLGQTGLHRLGSALPRDLWPLSNRGWSRSGPP